MVRQVWKHMESSMMVGTSICFHTCLCQGTPYFASHLQPLWPLMSTSHGFWTWSVKILPWVNYQVLNPDYKPGDKVYLNASDIQTNRPLRKLSHHRLGPFPIVKMVHTNSTFTINEQTSSSVQCSKTYPSPSQSNWRLSPTLSSAPGNHRWRRRMGHRRSLG